MAINYGEATKDMIAIGSGFIASGFLGRAVETKISPAVSPVSSTSDKLVAAAANNAPKAVLYFILDKMKLKGAAAASVGSIGYDLLVRATNSGVNPAAIYVNQYRIMNQNQNQIMRGIASPGIAPQAMPYYNPVQLQTTETIQPTPTWVPDMMERERRFGSMDSSSKEKTFNFISTWPETNMYKMYGLR